MLRCDCTVCNGTIKTQRDYENVAGKWRCTVDSSSHFQHESDIYGDLVVFDFIDDYHQLSVKSFMVSEYHVHQFAGECVCLFSIRHIHW